MVEIKFCGLTRCEDAAAAVRAGARYVGVVFAAGGPRSLDPLRGAAVLDGAGTGARRVGVFASGDPDVVLPAARAARLDVVQLHGGATPDALVRLRAAGLGVWVVVRVRAEQSEQSEQSEQVERAEARAFGGRADGGAGVADEATSAVAAAARVAALDGLADGILLDAAVPGRLGGAGVRLDWTALPPAIRPRVTPFILAGGLTPENVSEGIRLLRPAIVDVSSGIEATPGVKDPARMEAFVAAAWAVP